MQKNNKLISTLKNPVSLYVAFTMAFILVMSLYLYNKSNTNFYSLSGYEENISLENGTIFIGTDITNFNGPLINYMGKDANVKNITAGYYYKENETFKEIIVISNEIEDNTKEYISLKEFLSTRSFCYTAPKGQDESALNKKIVEKEKSLYFRIKYTNDKDEELNISIPLTVVKLTK